MGSRRSDGSDGRVGDGRSAHADQYSEVEAGPLAPNFTQRRLERRRSRALFQHGQTRRATRADLRARARGVRGGCLRDETTTCAVGLRRRHALSLHGTPEVRAREGPDLIKRDGEARARAVQRRVGRGGRRAAAHRETVAGHRGDARREVHPEVRGRGVVREQRRRVCARMIARATERGEGARGDDAARVVGPLSRRARRAVRRGATAGTGETHRV